MKTTHFAVCLAVMLATVILPSAYGNGRSTPGPAETLVKAVCEQRSDGALHQIFRARVTDSDGPTSMLSIRIGDTGQQVEISSIKSLTLARTGTSSDGFQKATLVRNDDRTQEVRVQVGTAKSPLRLTGFSTEGAKVNIELAQCRKVSFSANTSERDMRRSEKK